jgi:hypothetical protein
VLHGLVSVESAAAQYGVVLRPDAHEVDADATRARRDALRAARRPAQAGGEEARIRG